MAKRLAGLASSMIESRGAPAGGLVTAPGPAAIAPPMAKTPAQYGEPLNFRVPLEFRRRFRRYAADHDMKLNEVLYAAFEALLHAQP